MSASFPRVDNSPTNFVPPPGQPDPFSNLGKVDEILNGPLDSGIHRHLAGKQLLDNADQYGDNPVDWEERGKTRDHDFWNKESGVAAKPKDPRLKKKDGDGDARPKGDTADKSATSQDLVKTEDKQDDRKKADAFDEKPKPYDPEAYYKKNSGHLDGGRATDWLNQQAYETKAREDAGEGSSTKPQVKRTGLSAETQYGNYTPELREGPLSNTEIERQAWHKGHEQVNRLNGGEGFTQTNRGLWAMTEDVKGKEAGTASFGMGTRAEVANVYDLPGSGEATVRANGLAGFESSAGGKFKAKATEGNISAGAEMRAGVFGEVGGDYRPITWEPKIFGAPLDLSPEVSGAGRVFTGGEVGAGFKAAWHLVPDPATGKMSPEASIEAKGSAFVGGKAEGEASVGLAGIGNVGGSVAGLYGVGAEGKAKLGLGKDDKGRTKLKFELKGALALGLGVGAGIKGEINVDGLVRFGANLARANREVIHKVAEGAKTAVNAVKNAAETVKTGVETAANKVKQGVEKAAGAVQEGLGMAMNAVKNGVVDAVDNAKDIANKIADKAKEVVNTVADKAKEVVNTVVDKGKEVVDKIEDGVKSAAKKVGGFFKGLFGH
jgi:hypothetical protein